MGPVPMCLGPFAFEGIGFGFDQMQRSLQTPWAKVSVAQTMDRLQWTGPTSDELTIRGVLFPTEYGGQGSLNGLISAAEAGQPLMLITGDAAEGLIYGNYAIQGIDEDRSFIDGAGRPRRNAYTIKLSRAEGRAGGLVSSILSLF